MLASLGDRRLFPNLVPRAYLNHAAISPPSTLVERAIASALFDVAGHGVSAFPRTLAQRERLRGKVARLIGSSTDEIAFVASTTNAISSVATCFPWVPGDTVVLFDGEFPTNVTPWQRAASAHDLRLAWLSRPDPHDPNGCLQALAEQLRRGVRLVAVSAVQFQTGLRMPLQTIGELCRTYGAALCVDAMQACGMVSVDVETMNIDFLACGAHKWLMGVDGCGFLYARRERGTALRPHLAGWLSHEQGLRFLFEGAGHLRYDRPLKSDVRMLEAGSCNSLGFHGLEAALDPILELGVESIYDHVQRYHDRLESGLADRGWRSVRSPDPAARSGILSVEPLPQLPFETILPRLLEHGVSASTPDGWLRFAPHWPNALEEVDVVLDAIDALASPHVSRAPVDRRSSSSDPPIINLRSDTQTLPTQAMLAAMACAPLGDDGYGEDPTVNRLETMAAERLGHEAGLFVLSGHLGNLIALMVHARPGEEVLIDPESHIYYYTTGSLASVAGLIPWPLAAPFGRIDPHDVSRAVRGRDVHFSPTRLLCLENTHNRAGGRVVPLALHEELCRVAHDHGLAVHLDGARIFNAAVAARVDVDAFTRPVDSAMFCLSKGLSCPLGSVLTGSRAFIEHARHIRQRLGGGMRQAGVLAAAGIVALETMVERLAEDHANAQRLGAGLADVAGFAIDRTSVETNMVYVDHSGCGVTTSEVVRRLAAARVLVSEVPPRQIRLVTHRHHTTEIIDEAIRRIILAMSP